MFDDDISIRFSADKSAPHLSEGVVKCKVSSSLRPLKKFQTAAFPCTYQIKNSVSLQYNSNRTKLILNHVLPVNAVSVKRACLSCNHLNFKIRLPKIFACHLQLLVPLDFRCERIVPPSISIIRNGFASPFQSGGMRCCGYSLHTTSIIHGLVWGG